jgi:hypothetical protein
MAMKKAGITMIKGEIYPYDVIVALGATRDEIIAYAEKRFVNAFTAKDLEELVMVGQGRTVRLENKAMVCWTKHFPKTSSDFGFLAHEIFHTADITLHHAGLKLTAESDEAWAYYIGWLTDRIYSAFKL